MRREDALKVEAYIAFYRRSSAASEDDVREKNVSIRAMGTIGGIFHGKSRENFDDFFLGENPGKMMRNLGRSGE